MVKYFAAFADSLATLKCYTPENVFSVLSVVTGQWHGHP